MDLNRALPRFLTTVRQVAVAVESLPREFVHLLGQRVTRNNCRTFVTEVRQATSPLIFGNLAGLIPAVPRIP